MRSYEPNDADWVKFYEKLTLTFPSCVHGWLTKAATNAYGWGKNEIKVCRPNQSLSDYLSFIRGCLTEPHEGDGAFIDVDGNILEYQTISLFTYTSVAANIVHHTVAGALARNALIKSGVKSVEQAMKDVQPQYATDEMKVAVFEYLRKRNDTINASGVFTSGAPLNSGGFPSAAAFQSFVGKLFPHQASASFGTVTGRIPMIPKSINLPSVLSHSQAMKQATSRLAREFNGGKNAKYTHYVDIESMISGNEPAGVIFDEVITRVRKEAWDSIDEQILRKATEDAAAQISRRLYYKK